MILFRLRAGEINLFTNRAYCLKILFKMKTYHKFYRIKAPPDEVYTALVTPLSIELWTGMSAVMEETPGTEFSLFDGDISGINLEFVRGERILQEWFFGDQEERSIVRIELRPDKAYTLAELTHTNIPDISYEEMKEGWDSYYFGALKEFFR